MTTGFNRTITIWNLDEDSSKIKFERHLTIPKNFANGFSSFIHASFSRNGKLLATVTDQVIILWNFFRGEIVHAYPIDRNLDIVGNTEPNLSLVENLDETMVVLKSERQYRKDGPTTLTLLKFNDDIGNSKLLKYNLKGLEADINENIGFYLKSVKLSPNEKVLVTTERRFSLNDKFDTEFRVKLWNTNSIGAGITPTFLEKFDIKGHFEPTITISETTSGKHMQIEIISSHTNESNDDQNGRDIRVSLECTDEGWQLLNTVEE